MCKLKKNSFELKVTSDGKEYLEMNYNRATKKSQGDDNNEVNHTPILLAQMGKRCCPVNSFKLYLSKVTHLEDLSTLQIPITNMQAVGGTSAVLWVRVL